MLEWPSLEQMQLEGVLGRTARAWLAWSSCWQPWQDTRSQDDKKRRNGHFWRETMLRLHMLRRPLETARMLSTPTPSAHVPDQGVYLRECSIIHDQMADNDKKRSTSPMIVRLRTAFEQHPRESIVSLLGLEIASMSSIFYIITTTGIQGE